MKVDDELWEIQQDVAALCGRMEAVLEQLHRLDDGCDWYQEDGNQRQSLKVTITARKSLDKAHKVFDQFVELLGPVYYIRTRNLEEEWKQLLEKTQGKQPTEELLNHLCEILRFGEKHGVFNYGVEIRKALLQRLSPPGEKEEPPHG